MTNIIKWTEGKPFIYSSSKPFPTVDFYTSHPGGSARVVYHKDFKNACDDWFSQATKRPVKQGEEKKFEDHAIDLIVKILEAKPAGEADLTTMLSEGVEIGPSCFKIETEQGPDELGKWCYWEVAVFVPPVSEDSVKIAHTAPVVDHANEKAALKERSKIIDLLEKYSLWLEKQGYLDTDWRSEEPFAIDEFLKNNQR